MSLKITIKKGLDLRLNGEVKDSAASEEIFSKTYAIYPDDFHGFIPKPDIHPGDKVLSGTPLCHDKKDENIRLISPVSGIIKDIVRGERRHIERFVIEADDKNPHQPLKFDSSNLSDSENAKIFLKNSGLWAMMRQRPFDIVPLGNSIPRDIFVTAIDSAPLAPDPAIIAAGHDDALAEGVKLLKLLTPGNVYISRRPGSLADVPEAIMIDVKGPHPAGNPGVIIANVAPINKGEVVWTLNLMTLRRIGQAALTGIVPNDTIVAITGPEVKEPKMVRTIVGVELRALLNNELKTDENIRIISGNVLTGEHETIDGYLHCPYRHVTVIAEGDHADEFMGWASISPQKMSQNRSFPSRLFGRHKFSPDARLNGSPRAFIMSGEYDKYLPMDIMAEYLLKAFMAKDIEKMEKLGAYEVAPEDFALGEYADTSKLETQKIVREGLDYLRKELE